MLSRTDKLLALDTEQKRPQDKREQRSIKLSNGLDVLLVSDPTFNKSAAALDVHVGSLEDPEEHLGLAHFLEHMLFLGTEKYPDVDEYNRFLSSHQGWSNAYTSETDTNYFFEVGHEGFEGSLDRFAQFFISPLFSPQYVERELNAVHSEHQKNLEDDNWRENRVVHTLLKKDHPASKFHTGNLDTLKGTSREVLTSFYKKHYSANRMKLVVLSLLPLDKLESLVRTTWTAVPNSNLAELSYERGIFDNKALPRRLHIRSVKDLRKLSLVFEGPDAEPYWESKPTYMLSHLLGHEGRGSLLSLLKKENLASGLSASYDSSPYGGLLEINVELSEKGQDQKDRIVELFFSYINLLKRDGYQKYIYDERKVMADLNYIYKEPQEGGSLASRYAVRMQTHPALQIEKRDSLFYKYSEKDFQDFLNIIDAKALTLVSLSPKEQTDQVETYYGAQFGLQKIPSDLAARWQTMAVHEDLKLPIPSEFLPSNLEILSSQTATKPVKLIDDNQVTFWFQQDDSIHLPKAQIHLTLLNRKVNENPQDYVKSILYTSAINEGLNEWGYELQLMGLEYTLSRTNKGIQVEFAGYSEHLPKLMKEVASRLHSIRIDERRFEIIKEDLKRNISNMAKSAAYKQLLYEFDYLTQKNTIHTKSFYNPEGDASSKVDLISSVTLDQLKDYAEDLYKNTSIEGAAYGSLRAPEIQAAIHDFLNALDSLPLGKQDLPEEQVLIFPAGQPLAKMMTVQTNNNCWGQYLQFGRRTPKLGAILRIGQAHLSTSFFTELRTKQQLGYIVGSHFSFQEKALGLNYLVQSSTHSAVDIASRVSKWKKSVLQELAKMSDEQFETYKQSVIQELLEKDKTIEQKLQTMLFETVTMKGEFHYKEKIAEAAKHLEKKELVEAFHQAFEGKNQASLSLYLTTDAKDLHKKLASEQEIQDAKSFKKDTPTF